MPSRKMGVFMMWVVGEPSLGKKKRPSLKTAGNLSWAPASDKYLTRIAIAKAEQHKSC